MRTGSVLAYAALVAWSLVCAFPLYWVAIASIKAPIEFVGSSHYLPFFDFLPSLDAWRDIFGATGSEVLERVVNTTLVAISATFVTVGVGLLAAFGLTRVAPPFAMHGRFRTSLLLLMVLTRILPPVVVVLPIWFLVQSVDLDDTRTGLIVAYTSANLPVAIWLLRSFLLDVPSEIEEAATLDGAGQFRILLTITAPMLAGGLAATAALVFLLCWNEYLLAVYLAGDHAMTLPPFLASQMTTREQMAAADPEDYARLAVVVVVMVVPLALCYGAFSGLMARLARAGR